MGLSLVDLLRKHAAQTPYARCLAFEDELLTFHDLDLRSNALANALIDKGISAGDRVAILAQTGTVFYELVYACAKMGAIMTPLNWRLSPREIAGIMEDAAPKIIIVAKALAPLLVEAKNLPEHIGLESDYAVWRDAGSQVDPARPHATDDTTLLLYTSGTTGKPKGVMISHGNLSHVELMAREAWDFTAKSVNLVAMPLFHIGGIGYGMMALSQGGHTVLLQQPDPKAVIVAIGYHKVTHGFFVPTVIQRLVDYCESHADDADVAALRNFAHFQRILYGAAPIGEGLLRRAIASFDCGFSHAYGMTETAGTVISLPPRDHDPDGTHADRLRSCGKPLPWVELALIDPATGHEVDTGEVGEIRVRSGMVMKGYWRKAEDTAAAITQDGWLCTGDAAYRDADGYIYIHDRYKDMIVSGAENIYPTELENVIADHPGVSEVAVIGVPDAKWGETPRAYVVPHGDPPPSEAEIIAFTRERLARYKCPSSVRIVADLPRNASGKILKRELRELDREQVETAS